MSPVSWRNAPICASCNTAITGDALKALGRAWHPDHFRCSACGEPIAEGQFTFRDHRPYHEACFRAHVLPKCVYCHQPLEGRYYLDAWGDAYCPAHQEEWPRCTYCGRLVTDGAAAEGGDNPRCGRCRTVAIEDDETAGIILPPLVDWLQGEGITLDQAVRFRVQLVSRSELQRDDREGIDVLGKALVTRQSDTNTTTHLELHLLRGMPSPLFEGVAVHELGHAWLACRSVRGWPAWAEEGFCELLSHRWYLDMDTVESRHYAERIAENDSPIYGGGFRRLRELAESMGFDRLIRQVIATRALPSLPG